MKVVVSFFFLFFFLLFLFSFSLFNYLRREKKRKGVVVDKGNGSASERVVRQESTDYNINVGDYNNKKKTA